jgi:hypothetical protein
MRFDVALHTLPAPPHSSDPDDQGNTTDRQKKLAQLPPTAFIRAQYPSSSRGSQGSQGSHGSTSSKRIHKPTRSHSDGGPRYHKSSASHQSLASSISSEIPSQWDPSKIWKLVRSAAYTEAVHKYFLPFDDSCLEKILAAAAESYLEDMDTSEDVPMNAGELPIT